MIAAFPAVSFHTQHDRPHCLTFPFPFPLSIPYTLYPLPSTRLPLFIQLTINIATPSTHLFLLSLTNQPTLHILYTLIDHLCEHSHHALGLRSGETLRLETLDKEVRVEMGCT